MCTTTCIPLRLMFTRRPEKVHPSAKTVTEPEWRMRTCLRCSFPRVPDTAATLNRKRKPINQPRPVRVTLSAPGGIEYHWS